MEGMLTILIDKLVLHQLLTGWNSGFSRSGPAAGTPNHQSKSDDTLGHPSSQKPRNWRLLDFLPRFDVEHEDEQSEEEPNAARGQHPENTFAAEDKNGEDEHRDRRREQSE